MSIVRPSLLEPSSQPVLASAVDWLTSTLLGSLALGLCTIAVALAGLMMFEGRLPVRQGARAILGCFVIFGAPVIAEGLMGAWQRDIDAVAVSPRMEVHPASERAGLPPANYDPYAGASLRRN